MFLLLSSTDGVSTTLSSPSEADLPSALAIMHLELSLDLPNINIRLKEVEVSAAWLSQFLRYATLLREAIIDGDPLENACIQRLLGFTPISHYTFRLAVGGPMHELGTSKGMPTELRTEGGDMIVTRPVLRRFKIVETCLARAFQERILAVTEAVLESLVLRRWRPAVALIPLGAQLPVVVFCVLLLDCLHGLKSYHATLEIQKR